MARRAPKHPLHHDPKAVADAFDDSPLTMTELAILCDCSVSLISEIIGGTRNATPKMLPKLALALGCPKAQLRRKPESQPEPVAGL